MSAMERLNSDVDFQEQDELQPSSGDGDVSATGVSFADDAQGDRRTSIASSVLTVSKEERDADRDDVAIFVKLWLPHGAAFTMTAFRCMRVLDLKIKVAAELFVPPQTLVFVQAVDRPKLLDDDDEMLTELTSKHNKLDIYVNCTEPDFEFEVPENLRAVCVDIITVVVESDAATGHERTVVVEIENDNTQPRQFLGGYRCKKSGREYYHAASQTPNSFPSGCPQKVVRSRKVQTQATVSFEQQTQTHQSTQTGTPTEGRVLHAKEVVSDAELAKIVLIQKIFRGWKVRHGLEKLRLAALSNDDLKDEMKDSSKGYNKRMLEVLMYQLVERWRKRCLEYALSTKTAGPSRADFQDILEMQVNMLAVIERERMKLRDAQRKQKEVHQLEESCSPLKWKSQNGITISMETLKSQRATKLKQLYDKLFTGEFNTKSLKQNLVAVQESVKAMEEPKKQEMLNLIERELQLLEMGFEFKDVKSLHKRLEKLFANLIRDPTECKPARSKFYLCKQCRKMLPPKSFVIPLTRPEMKLCVSCHWIDNMSHERVDHGPFQQMLKELQHFESRRGCYRSMAFVLEVQDVKHLVDHVWHGQSAISQSTNLHELRLGRWDSSKEWSPWNTVLLSKKELTEHLAIADLKAVYGEVFINNVHIKNLIAQIHFKGMRKLK